MLDVGIVGEELAVQYLVEAGSREGLYEQLRPVGRACEAPFHGALEAFAGGGIFGHDCTCGGLGYVRYGLYKQKSLFFEREWSAEEENSMAEDSSSGFGVGGSGPT